VGWTGWPGWLGGFRGSVVRWGLEGGSNIRALSQKEVAIAVGCVN